MKPYCVVCKRIADDASELSLGESYRGRWWCFVHVEKLYASLGVKNTSEFWDLHDKNMK